MGEVVYQNGKIAIYKDKKDFLVRQIESNRFVRMGSQEVNYLLDLWQAPGEIRVNAEGSLTVEQKNLLTDKFKEVGFFGEKTSSQESKRKDISNMNIWSCKDVKALQWIIKGLNKIIFSVGPLILIAGVVVLIYLINARNSDYLVLLQNPIPVFNTLSTVIIILLIILSAVLHELAHAAANYHFTGEFSEMGIKLFFGLPVFYTNVSSMYLVNSRRASVVVSLAGIGLNLFLFFLGFNLSPFIYKSHLLLGQYLFSFAVVNLGFAVLNLIPFARYDGYWALRAVVGVDNLYIKSQALFFYLIKNQRKYSHSVIPIRFKIPMTLYGIVCYFFRFYLWYVLLRISYSILNRVNCPQWAVWTFLGILGLVSLRNLVSHTIEMFKNSNSHIQQIEQNFSNT